MNRVYVPKRTLYVEEETNLVKLPVTYFYSIRVKTN